MTRAAVREQLECAVSWLERAAAAGTPHVTPLEQAVDVATLLHAPDLAVRAWAVLARAPPEAWRAGVITNIPFDPATARPRPLERPREALDRDYPVRVQSDLEADLRARHKPGDMHIGLCANGHVEEAISVTREDVEREEVCSTLAVLGRIDEALALAGRLGLEPFRRRGVELVACIELVRVGRRREADARLATLSLDPHDHLHLALGFANRRPWGIYPFPDW